MKTMQRPAIDTPAPERLHTIDLTDTQVEFLAQLIVTNSSRLAVALRGDCASEMPEGAASDLLRRVNVGAVILGKLPTRVRFGGIS